MKKEKFDSLTKYLSNMQDRLFSKEVPPKHLNRERTYREFLSREVQMVKAQLDLAKLEGLENDKKGS